MIKKILLITGGGIGILAALTLIAGLGGTILTIGGFAARVEWVITLGMALMIFSLTAVAFVVAPFKMAANRLGLGPIIKETLAFPAMVMFFTSLWGFLILRTSAWESSLTTRVFVGIPILIGLGLVAFVSRYNLQKSGETIVGILGRSLLFLGSLTLIWSIIPAGVQTAAKRKLIRAQHRLIQESPEAVTFITLDEYNQRVTDRFSPEDGTPQWTIGCANPAESRLPRLFQRDPADAIHHDSLCGDPLRPLTSDEDKKIQETLRAIEEERRKKQEAERQEMERRVAEARAAAAMATPAPEPTPSTPPETPVPLPSDVPVVADRPPEVVSPPPPTPAEPKPQVPDARDEEERLRRKEILRREYARRYGQPETTAERRERLPGRSGYDYRERGSRGREDADRGRDRDGDQINSRLVVDHPIKLAFTLDDELSTEHTRPGQHFRGRTVTVIVANSTTVINRGSVVTGEVEDVSPARDKRDRPTITLRVTQVDGQDVTSKPLVVTGSSTRAKQIADVAKGAGIGVLGGALEKILRGEESNDPVIRDGGIGASAGVVIASRRGISVLIIPTNKHLEVYLTE